MHAKRAEDCLHFLGEAERRGLALHDVTIYNAALSACARCGEADKAFALLDKMRAAGLVPTERTYTALLNACGTTGRRDHAEAVVAQMRADGFAVGAYATASLIDCEAASARLGAGALQSAGASQSSRQALARCEALAIDARVAAPAQAAAASQGGAAGTRSAHGGAAPPAAAGRAPAAHEQSGDDGVASAGTPPAMPPGLFDAFVTPRPVFNALLAARTSLGDPRGAMTLFHAAAEHGVVPNGASYTHAVAALAATASPNGALLRPRPAPPPPPAADVAAVALAEGVGVVEETRAVGARVRPDLPRPLVSIAVALLSTRRAREAAQAVERLLLVGGGAGGGGGGGVGGRAGSSAGGARGAGGDARRSPPRRFAAPLPLPDAQAWLAAASQAALSAAAVKRFVGGAHARGGGAGGGAPHADAPPQPPQADAVQADAHGGGSEALRTAHLLWDGLAAQRARPSPATAAAYRSALRAATTAAEAAGDGVEAEELRGREAAVKSTMRSTPLVVERAPRGGVDSRADTQRASGDDAP